MKKWIEIRYRTIIIVIMTVGLIWTAAGCGNTSANADQDVSPVVGIIQSLWPSQEARWESLKNKLFSKDADLRREGVYELGEKPASTWKNTPEMLSIIATGDPDVQVRLAGLAILAALNEEQWLPKTLKSTMADPDKMVRKETVKIFGNQSNEQSMDHLMAILSRDPEPSVRSAAATALGNYQGSKVIRALLEGLADDDFSVNFRSRQSLKKITGQDYGYDDQAWLQWLATSKEK